MAVTCRVPVYIEVATFFLTFSITIISVIERELPCLRRYQNGFNFQNMDDSFEPSHLLSAAATITNVCRRTEQTNNVIPLLPQWNPFIRSSGG